MAKIIAKFGYLKGKSRGGYAKYIATREGVEKLDESLRGRPVTQAQQEFIQKLLEDFPDSKDCWSMRTTKNPPPSAPPRSLSPQTIELHMGECRESVGLPQVHGDPPQGGKAGQPWAVLLRRGTDFSSKVAQEVDAHRGNIWTAIYSLRREDAQRLGFDTAARWRDLLRSQAVTLAEGLKIPPTHLKWYAAFHNEGHHPHVHLIAYSTKPGEGFLTKQGMEKIRSALAQEIFRQDLVSVYQQQTAHRDELRRASREKVAGLVQQISGGACENPKLESLLRELARRLSNVKGKKVYGYLRPELKALVNQIVDELAKDERIAQLYDLWYQDKQAARNVYDERPLQRVPLSENPDFKPVRNAVIQAAIVLPPAPISPVEDEVEPDISEPSPSARWKTPSSIHPVFSHSRGKTKTLLDGGITWPPTTRLLPRMGRVVRGEAQRWFQKALAGFRKQLPPKRSLPTARSGGQNVRHGLRVEQDDLEAPAGTAPTTTARCRLRLGRHLGVPGVTRTRNPAAGSSQALAGVHEKQPNAYAMKEAGLLYQHGCRHGNRTKPWRYGGKAGLQLVSIEKARPADKLQYRLGYMALHGIGTDPSLETAYQYWRKAVYLRGQGRPVRAEESCALDPFLFTAADKRGERYLWESWTNTKTSRRHTCWEKPMPKGPSCTRIWRKLWNCSPQ